MDNFIRLEEIPNFVLSKYSISTSLNDYFLLINFHILPVYLKGEHKYVLIEDLSLAVNLLEFKYSDDLFSNYALLKSARIDIANHTFLLPPLSNQNIDPTLSSALVNLHNKLKHEEKNGKKISEQIHDYYAGSKVVTISENASELISLQKERSKQLNNNNLSKFTKSASYMGSKKPLLNFLYEAFLSLVPSNTVILDLMCGSGVASGMFNKNWRTYSSDSQMFCKILAKIHGGGFSKMQAQNILSKLLPLAKENFANLSNKLSEEIEQEDNLFFKNIDNTLSKKYASFIASFPTYTKTTNHPNWDPVSEVESRKMHHNTFPYCLFTAYFSNVYFGLRQCVEIDSIRFAIDQLSNENEKLWALGALVTTVSALGTTYGGHFAQPLFKDANLLSLKKLSRVLERRSSSITHDFTVRLLNLAELSESSKSTINLVDGPWHNAITVLEKEIEDSPIVAYLDAPYKREEYSRYYHVLETLCAYNYPSCTGIGLTPAPGERFRTEFFTKNTEKINNIFENIICSIINKNWMCAWNYSDSGAANIPLVIDKVASSVDCEIRSFSTQATHKSHGGVNHKRVTEYLIFFKKRDLR